MSADLDELQKLELKEAFDEFDKVIYFDTPHWFCDYLLYLLSPKYLSCQFVFHNIIVTSGW